MYPNEYIKNLVSNIPLSPGVYQMKDEDGQVIYVGKAISLRKRVRQYFQKNNKSKRIENMVSLIRDIEYIVTKNEAEALALECNYIKEKNPKFNVMLKDDKSYPYLKITVKDEYPMIYITRRKINDGSMYLGPYTDVSALKESMYLIKEIFPIKRCRKVFKKKEKAPCLYYHIGRCLGPCSKEVSREEYQDMINQIIKFLQGKKIDLIGDIVAEIDKCIEKLDFEKAAILKRRKDAIEKIYEKQDVANLKEVNTDIWGYVIEDNKIYIQIFKIRDYKVVLNDNLQIADCDNIEENLLSVISRYYLNSDSKPKKICVKLQDDTLKLLQEFFDLKQLKIECINPQKGQKLNLIKMVENNIKVNIESKNSNVVEDMCNMLKIPLINSIECYDISNLKNEYIVGCMIRFEDGRLNKSMYRKFKIKSTLTQDDPKCMAEVLTRRIKRRNEWPLPDIFLLDGGKTQISKVKEAIKDLDDSTLIYGMVKNDNHRTRALMDINFNEIDISSNKKVFNFITFLQDEIHRFTINYHRSLRDKIKE